MRVQERAGSHPHLAQAGRPLLARRHHARDHVAVAAEELGRAVEHEGRAQLERPLQDRGHEGRVHDHRHPVRVTDRRRDVHEVEGGVARGLEHDQAGVGADGALDAFGRA